MEGFLPPRLEDAGLEECALPPEAINEAFSKAAELFKSRVVVADDDDDDNESDGCCVEGPAPSSGEKPAAALGGSVCEEGGFSVGMSRGRRRRHSCRGGISSGEVLVMGGEVAEDSGGDYNGAAGEGGKPV
ncbi:unnamed protein product [Spirodela intermedia]|uniref:Uncharacterized protein n=1 Tax=Spirodela intermedia TaxID=51605 RepID=A0A7I8J8A7_SPIIN|nr:unnamed protein product [Spirodela intermedia]CAA6665975.1 unnamed protein product [Spirodela intermedia]